MLLVRFLLVSTILAAGAVQAQSVDILPDENLTGWTRIPFTSVDGVKPKLQWRVDTAQHTLICTGDGQHEWLRYDKPLGDFVLEVDWRFTPKGEVKYNAGVGVRLSKWGELWIQAQTGPKGGYLFGDNLVNGAIERVSMAKEMKENRVKPAGEWNHYEIRAQGDKITLSVNGALVSEFPGVAIRRGYIGLEAEGYEITFRNIKLRILD